MFDKLAGLHDMEYVLTMAFSISMSTYTTLKDFAINLNL